MLMDAILLLKLTFSFSVMLYTKFSRCIFAIRILKLVQTQKLEKARNVYNSILYSRVEADANFLFQLPPFFTCSF